MKRSSSILSDLDLPRPGALPPPGRRTGARRRAAAASRAEHRKTRSERRATRGGRASGETLPGRSRAGQRSVPGRAGRVARRDHAAGRAICPSNDSQKPGFCRSGRSVAGSGDRREYSGLHAHRRGDAALAACTRARGARRDRGSFRPTALWEGAPMVDVLSYPLYQRLRERNRVFSGLLASGRAGRIEMSVDGGATEEVRARLVSGNYFDVLGVPASIGRTFSAAGGRSRRKSPDRHQP